MKIDNSAQFADFRSVVAVSGDYMTAEPFIKWDFDMRIQKIGPHYRGFKRQSPNWKGNVGNMSVLTDMEVTPEYKRMADECSKLFGGLDILGLDLRTSSFTLFFSLLPFFFIVSLLFFLFLNFSYFALNRPGPFTSLSPFHLSLSSLFFLILFSDFCSSFGGNRQGLYPRA